MAVRTVNGYLRSLSGSLILRNAQLQKVNIDRSIGILQARLKSFFSNEISEHKIFGSYKRQTILPRSMDPRSDVDYMVVFSDSDYRPQTYLDKLRRFVRNFYGNSEIKQDHPTIRLELNHIRFELVPAIDHWWHGLRVPASASDYEDWVDTDPRGFNIELARKNAQNKSMIKPLVRLLKLWNARNDYPFESYLLEKQVVNMDYSPYLFVGKPLNSHWDYFYRAMDSLELDYNSAQWKKSRLETTKQLVAAAKDAESTLNFDLAISRIKTIFRDSS